MCISLGDLVSLKVGVSGNEVAESRKEKNFVWVAGGTIWEGTGMGEKWRICLSSNSVTCEKFLNHVFVWLTIPNCFSYLFFSMPT